MNVLLTCAGRRNYLVAYFREALGAHGHVYAADANANAPAMHEADQAFVVPPVDHPDYFDHLFDICHNHQIRLLIPLNDLELPILAKQREKLCDIGIIPVISSLDVVNTCFDKWATFQFLSGCGIASPKTYLSLEETRMALSHREITFPLVVKPRWGSASIGIEYPHDLDELELAYHWLKKRITRTILANVSAHDNERSVLIQERLSGQEYGLDVINDLNGHYATTLARLKLGMRAGETDRAITVANEQIEKLGAAIGQRLGHIGNLDCDVMVSEEGCSVLEMNPRFGGGYPFSHMAGANLPAALIAWANGSQPDQDWLRVRPDVMAAKCDRLVVLERS